MNPKFFLLVLKQLIQLSLCEHLTADRNAFKENKTQSMFPAEP